MIDYDGIKRLAKTLAKIGPISGGDAYGLYLNLCRYWSGE